MTKRQLLFKIVTILMLASFLLSVFGCSTPVETPAAAEQPTAAPADDAGSETEVESTDIPEEPEPAEPTESILVIADARDPSTLDPAQVYDGSDRFTFQMYETLLRVKDASAEVIPWLAEDWDVSDDFQTYTFYLKEGVTFHDGYPFNADAVKFSLDRMISLGKGLSWAFKMVMDENSVEVVDEYTVRIQLTNPYPAFPGMIASKYGAPIISPGVMEHEVDGDMGLEWANHNSAGTGPYKLFEWKPKEEVSMVRFEDYWQGWDGNHIDRLIFKNVPDPTSRRLMLETGEASFAVYLNFEDVPLLEANPDFKVVRSTPGESTFNYFILMNTRQGPLTDIKIREAISWAFPYQDTIQEVFMGMGAQAIGPLPQVMPNHNKDLFVYHQDLDKARDLLAEAGYPGGEGLTLSIAYSQGGETGENLYEIMAATLTDLGIEVEGRPYTWGAMMDNLVSQETAPDLNVADWWPDYPDPDSFLGGITEYFLWGGRDEADYYYYNEELKQLLLDAAFETDTNKRRDMYYRAQEIMVEDIAAVWVFDEDSFVTMDASLQGFVHNPFYIMIPDFYQMWVE